MSALLDAALWYAKQGAPVFPCKPNKRPYVEHGLLDATKDPEQIRAWWTRWPKANVGVATGDGGLVVVDVDVKGGRRATKAGRRSSPSLVPRSKTPAPHARRRAAASSSTAPTATTFATAPASSRLASTYAGRAATCSYRRV